MSHFTRSYLIRMAIAVLVVITSAIVVTYVATLTSDTTEARSITDVQ